MNTNKIIAILIAVLVVIGGAFYFMRNDVPDATDYTNTTQNTNGNTNGNTDTSGTSGGVTTTVISTTTTYSTLAGPGEHCGGNMSTAKSCVPNYKCTPKPGSTLPFGDVGGTCTKQ